VNQCEIAASIVRKGAYISEGGQAKVYAATYAGSWRQMANSASSWKSIQAHLCLIKFKRIMPSSCAMASSISMIKGSHTWTSRFSTCSGLLLLSTDAVFQRTYTLVHTHTYVCKYIYIKSHRWPPLPERFRSAGVDAHVYAYTFVYSVVYMYDDDCFYYHKK